jgi:hypothetical protein
LVKQLDITRTPIKSLAGLPFLPRLAVFIADRTQIESFTNFKAIKKTSTISLKNTPVSRVPAYRVSVLVALGEQNCVKSIDGGCVSKELRERAKAYPECCEELVNLGALLPARPTEIEGLQRLCEQYGVEPPSVIGEDEKFSDTISETEDRNDPPDFPGLLAVLKEEHREVWRRGKAQFGLLNDDDENLNEEVIAILEKHHVADVVGTDVDVLTAVERLCALVPRRPSLA